ncbi:hypothetical protein [Flagellimonas sp.]|uniref:hypothetical protein n=1 Tax=Flagellimonas sp. TaxID=2058762 RepID=UPI003BAA4A72
MSCNFDFFEHKEMMDSFSGFTSASTLDMMRELDVDLQPHEVDEILRCNSCRDAFYDFIPMEHSKTWYNVRIGLERFSIITTSEHTGFLDE